MNSSEPLLSVVVTSRNDNHGKNLLRRMQTFVNCLIGQCQRHQLRSELIIVEWNPPADREPLVQALQWPQKREYCQVRIIQVPPELHHKFDHSEALPLFQMIAKNVGIRRAKGQFVLATNIDILFNDALMQHMAAGNLKPGYVYRIDRHDAMEDVPVDGPVEEQLRYCDTHQLRVNFDWATYPVSPDGECIVAPNDIVAEETGVVFGRGWFSPFEYQGERFRWFSEWADLIVQRPPDAGKVLCLEMESGPGAKDGVCILCVQDEDNKIVAKGALRGRRRVYLDLPFDPESKGPYHFRISAMNKGVPAPKTPYILNARVFRCCWVEKQLALFFGVRSVSTENTTDEGFRTELLEEFNEYDIADLESGIRFLENWDHPEKSSEGSFRWMKPGATISIATRWAQSQVLRLEVEPGPTLGFRPFTLQVFDGQGELLARGPVRGRSDVFVRLPRFSDERVELKFDLNYERTYVTGLPRDTFCRVVKIEWSDETQFQSIEAPDAASLNYRAVHVPEGWKFRMYQVRAIYHALFVWRRMFCNLAKRLFSRKPPTAVLPSLTRPAQLHTNACGDFTMLAREDWFATNGNPELEMYSLHLDSLYCYQAHHAGFPEVILRDPMRIYHIEHSKGSGWTPEGEKDLMDRLAKKGIPVLEYQQLLRWATQMKKKNEPMLFGDENWGLGQHELPESNPDSVAVRAA